MGFEVTAQAYGRFMGRFSEPLASVFADAAGVVPGGGQSVLDVGCGPGALTSTLAERLGPDRVHACDPSRSFVEAARTRLPGVDVVAAAAEQLPYPDDGFDAALAQLVVHFMRDPVAGLREMARVTRPGGVVAACVWDHAGRQGPVSAFWDVVREFDPGEEGEGLLAGTERGQLGRLLREAGLADVRESSLAVTTRYESFEDWWEPYTFGVGPAGAYVAALDDERREALRALAQLRLPQAPFEVRAEAWCAVGSA
ncbi:class I SAM-dependent methyltransferase [Pedococcus sp. NPDC057267]|uniref:class I SAM-dependent methyltransferase n=1 Tax=Pedococcus sp. NPDC057267 TaxID=3346077 RepID=UPI003635EB6C